MKRPLAVDAAFVRLGLDPALAEKQITAVTARPVCNTQLVALAIEGPDPQVVTAVANTLPAVLVDELRRIESGRFAASKANLTQQLEEMSRQVATTRLQLGDLEQQRTAHEKLEYSELNSALTQYQASYANLLQRYDAVGLAEAQSTGAIVLIEPAAVPHIARPPARPGKYAVSGRDRRPGRAGHRLPDRIPRRSRAHARGPAAHRHPAGAGRHRPGAGPASSPVRPAHAP